MTYSTSSRIYTEKNVISSKHARDLDRLRGVTEIYNYSLDWNTDDEPSGLRSLCCVGGWPMSGHSVSQYQTQVSNAKSTLIQGAWAY